MRFASLGSGSEGNGLVVEAGRQGAPMRVLIDCGFGLAQVRRRLARLGLAPTDLHAIFVTHEHSDHLGGAVRLARAAGAQLFMTRGTAAAGLRELPEGLPLQLIEADRPIELEGLRVDPVPVPHDAREPVQFVIEDSRSRLGVLTDLGQSTPHLVRRMTGLHALVLECNHDAAMLRDGPYPWSLKRRIAGPYGHLENAAAAALLAQLDQRCLGTVVAAHLSRSNNRPDLARRALSAVWAGANEQDVLVADQDQGLGWTEV